MVPATLDAPPVAVKTLDLPALAASRAFGHRLGKALRSGDVVTLSGSLGVGKSEIARAAIRALLGAKAIAPSPTFALVIRHPCAFGDLLHVDLYRLGDPAEALALDLPGAREGAAALVVEWPERMECATLPDRLDIVLEDLGPRARRATLAAGPSWRDRLARLR